MYIAAALSRALRRQVTPSDIGMPLAGQLPVIDLGLAYPDTSADAAGNVALLWTADLAEATVLRRGGGERVGRDGMKHRCGGSSTQVGHQARTWYGERA
jgi:hypothetical protein